MADFCDVCDTEDMLEWFETECCGNVCNECFNGEVLFTGFSGERAYTGKHPHDFCSVCEYMGINDDLGLGECRSCRREKRVM